MKQLCCNFPHESNNNQGVQTSFVHIHNSTTTIQLPAIKLAPLIIQCNWTWFFHIPFHDLLALNFHQTIFSGDDNKIIVFMTTHLTVNWAWFFHYPHDVLALDLFNLLDNHCLIMISCFSAVIIPMEMLTYFFKETLDELLLCNYYFLFILRVLLSNCQIYSLQSIISSTYCRVPPP